MRSVSETYLHANGIQLALFEWTAAPGAPIVFFAHATGFHARVWDQVIERLPGVHCYAIDMRGHGRSDKPAPPYPWRNFALDVVEVARQLDLHGVLAVGHSKGGYAITLAAAMDTGLFSKLLLIDPVILPRERYGTGFGGDHFAAKRRNNWSSAQEMFERFVSRSPFDQWDPAVLHDYVDYGLLSNPDGEGYVLACPPAIEAATYAGSGNGGEIYDAMPALDIPVRILRARTRAESAVMDMSNSPTAPDVAANFRHADDVFLPKYSHFMPMEDPGFIASQVREMLDN
ncbi:MAG: alpha/beta hydrolase [Tepidiformaceae bacterium]